MFLLALLYSNCNAIKSTYNFSQICMALLRSIFVETESCCRDFEIKLKFANIFTNFNIIQILKKKIKFIINN